jgi:hypothetical protein
MTKPNTGTITQTMRAEPVEYPPASLYDVEIAFDALETKIADLIEQYKKDFATEIRAESGTTEIDINLCVQNGAACLKISTEFDGISSFATIPIAGLAYPYDTFENFDPRHNAGIHRRDPEMVAVGVTDRAALAAALRTLADNVAADPIPPQAAPTRAE